MTDWIKVLPFNEIPEPGARVVRTDTVDIALFRTADGAVFALKDECPHKQGPLSQGIVHGQAVTCPLHNLTVDLATGEALGPDTGCVRRYETKVEEGLVYLRNAGAFR